MGDRVLMQVVSKTDFGPVVYLHWSGSHALEIVVALKQRMADRTGDISYTTARLVQEALEYNAEGNLSVGVRNTAAVLTKEDSHGDAGVVLIHCDEDFRCDFMGGYPHVPAN